MNKLAIIVIMLFGWIPVFAQTGNISEQYAYKHFTTRDGLSQMQVSQMMQDSRGFLWFATKFGFSRYDGRNFKSFSPNNGLSASHYNGIIELTDGTIVLRASGNASVVLVNGNHFREVDFSDEPNVWLSGIIPSHEGGFFFALNRNFSDSSLMEICKYDMEHGSFTKLFSAKNMVVIDVDGNGNLFACSEAFLKNDFTTIKLYSGNGVVLDSIVLKVRDTHFQINKKLGLIWLLDRSSADNIYYKISSKNSKLHVVDTIVDVPNFDKGFFSNVFMDDTSFVYADSSGIINRFKDGEVQKFTYFGIIANAIYDKEGNLWVCGEEGVVCLYQRAISEIRLNLIEGKNDNVWSMATDAKNGFLYASFTKGCFSSADGNKTYKKINKQWEVSLSKTLRNKGTFGAYYTSKGGWIYPYVKAIYYENKGVSRGFDFVDSIGYGSETFAVIEDETNSTIYISFYRSIYALDENTLRVKKILSGQFDLNFATVSFVFDHKGRLNALGRGAKYYENGKWYAIDQFKGLRIMSGVKDFKGNIWVNSIDNLYFYSYTDLKKIDGVPLKAMALALTTYGKWLIIGGSVDLVFMDLEEFYRSGNRVFYRFDAGSGLDIIEGGQNSFYHGGDGSIYWACMDKVVRFWPDKLVAKTSVSRPELLEFTASSFDSDSVIHLDLLTRNFILPKGFRNFSIEFVSAVFNNNSQLRYRHRLLGLTNSFKTDVEGQVEYYNLPPGKYVFEVQSSTDGLEWSAPLRLSTITIPAFWYEFKWIKVTGLILFLILATLLFFRIQKNRRESLLRKTTKQLRMGELQLQVLRSKNIPHFSGNVFNNIDYLIDSGQYDSASKYIGIVSRLFTRLLNEGDKPAKTLIDEIEFAEDYLKLEQLRFKENLDYEIIGLDAQTAKVMIPNMFVHTLVENAVKHGIMSVKGYGNLIIAIQDLGQDIKVVIKDDGIGLKASEHYNQNYTKKGLNLLKSQVEIYNKLNDRQMNFKINDIYVDGTVAGVEASLTVPKKYKFY